VISLVAPYQIVVVVDSISAGAITVGLGNNSGTITPITAPGTYTLTAPASVAGTNISVRGVGASTTAVVSKLYVKPVTAFTTNSGDFYQLATDGKFYRLWKNQHGNSASPAGAGYAFTVSGTGDAVTANYGVGAGGSNTTTRVQTGASARL